MARLQYFEYLFLILIGFYISCGSVEEDPCDTYPRTYLSSVMDDDIMPVALYVHDGSTFVTSDAGLEAAYDSWAGGETLSGITGGFLNTITFRSDTEADVRFQLQNFGDTTVTFQLAPFAPGLIIAQLEGAPGSEMLLTMSDDCTMLNRCLFITSLNVDDEWDGLLIDVCNDRTPDSIAETVGSVRGLKEGDQLLVIQFNQDFLLE